MAKLTPKTGEATGEFSEVDDQRFERFIRMRRLEHLQNLLTELRKLSGSGNDFWQQVSVLLGKVLQQNTISAIVLKILRFFGLKAAEMPDDEVRRLMLERMIGLAIEVEQQALDSMANKERVDDLEAKVAEQQREIAALKTRMIEIEQQMRLLLEANDQATPVADDDPGGHVLYDGIFDEDTPVDASETLVGSGENTTLLSSTTVRAKLQLLLPFAEEEEIGLYI